MAHDEDVRRVALTHRERFWLTMAAAQLSGEHTLKLVEEEIALKSIGYPSPEFVIASERLAARRQVVDMLHGLMEKLRTKEAPRGS